MAHCPKKIQQQQQPIFYIFRIIRQQQMLLLELFEVNIMSKTIGTAAPNFPEGSPAADVMRSRQKSRPTSTNQVLHYTDLTDHMF